MPLGTGYTSIAEPSAADKPLGCGRRGCYGKKAELAAEEVRIAQHHADAVTLCITQVLLAVIHN